MTVTVHFFIVRIEARREHRLFQLGNEIGCLSSCRPRAPLIPNRFFTDGLSKRLRTVVGIDGSSASCYKLRLRCKLGEQMGLTNIADRRYDNIEAQQTDDNIVHGGCLDVRQLCVCKPGPTTNSICRPSGLSSVHSRKNVAVKQLHGHPVDVQRVLSPERTGDQVRPWARQRVVQARDVSRARSLDVVMVARQCGEAGTTFTVNAF
jgi:hypothetical protein